MIAVRVSQDAATEREKATALAARTKDGANAAGAAPPQAPPPPKPAPAMPPMPPAPPPASAEEAPLAAAEAVPEAVPEAAAQTPPGTAEESPVAEEATAPPPPSPPPPASAAASDPAPDPLPSKQLAVSSYADGDMTPKGTIVFSGPLRSNVDAKKWDHHRRHARHAARLEGERGEERDRTRDGKGRRPTRTRWRRASHGGARHRALACRDALDTTVDSGGKRTCQ